MSYWAGLGWGAGEMEGARRATGVSPARRPACLGILLSIRVTLSHKQLMKKLDFGWPIPTYSQLLGPYPFCTYRDGG